MPTLPFALLLRGWGTVAALICVLWSTAVHAQTAGPLPPRQQLVLRNHLAARWNPLGMVDDARLQYRYRLYDGTTPLGRDNFVGLTVAVAAAPTMMRYGLAVEIQPLSVWSLWLALNHEYYRGAFASLQSFPSPLRDYRDSTLAKNAERKQNYSTSGIHLTAGTQLQARFGPLAARSQGRLGWIDLELRPGDRVFYTPLQDLLVGNRGWFFAADTDLLWRSAGPWSLGVRWSLAQALYQPAHFAPGEDPDLAPGMIQRAGPLLQYAWPKKNGESADHTLTLVVNWWLASPTRMGQDPSRPRGVPYLLLAYGWAMDLLAPH